MKDILFGFPEYRWEIGKILADRVRLWHSAVLYAIGKLRQTVANTRSTGVELTLEGWKRIAEGEIRAVLWSICEEERKEKEAWMEFKRKWILGNGFCELGWDNTLKFKS